MNCATLPFTQDIQMVSLVAAIVASIVFLELFPERSIWCTPVKQEEEHIVAVSTSWGVLYISHAKTKQRQ